MKHGTGYPTNTSSRSVKAAGAFASAVFSVVAFAAYQLMPPAPLLGDRFPAAPTAAELWVLRKAYSGRPENWPRPRLLPGARFVEMASLQFHPRPNGEDANLARLGQELFEDPLLSASGQIACQSCHNRRLGWGDALPRSFGHSRVEGKRNAQSLFTVGYKSNFFWDGRAQSLEAQALAPLADEREMANHDFTDLLQRINASDHYRGAFAPLTGESEITLANLKSALAAFQRTLERPTQFDRFLQGDRQALSATEI